MLSGGGERVHEKEKSEGIFFFVVVVVVGT